VEPREGHFTTRDRWPLRELPGLLRRYGTVLRRTDCRLRQRLRLVQRRHRRLPARLLPRTRDQWTIISLGGFSAEEFVTLVDRVNAAVPAGDIAAVELNVSCHNVNFDFSTILQDVLDEAVPRSNHPVLPEALAGLRLPAQRRPGRPRGRRRAHRHQHRQGAAPRPAHGQPLLANRFGGLSGRAVKPIGLRVVAELRDAGITLPIVATGGIRTVDDCREYFWAGADAVSLGSATWLASYPATPSPRCADWPVRRLLRTLADHDPRPFPSAASPDRVHDAMIGAPGH
jgi:dihydroorotate dehydrogenase (NAD+) catalytic subunit